MRFPEESTATAWRGLGKAALLAAALAAGTASLGQGAFQGGVPSGRATAGVMDLPLDEAIRRGEANNLGAILGQAQAQAAAGARLQQLQELLPAVDAKASVSVNQVNFAAEGFKFPGVNPIVGPFQVEDFRAYLTWSLLNIPSLENYMAAKHNYAGAKLTADDAREMVVLAVGNGYLTCVADAARVEAVKAELATTKVSVEQATASHDAGTSPRLDVLRAQVDNQNVQQQLIVAENQLQKDMLALGRSIGLPAGQKFRLTDTAPYAALEGMDAEKAVAEAEANRRDLKALDEQVAAAAERKKASAAQQMPAAGFQGDFGDIGNTAAHSHDTYTATGSVSAPVLQVAKTRGDVESADAQLKQMEARRDDMKQQIDEDVRDALLDIASAAKLVEAARSNVELANEALSEAQQRFKAGVADNLAVSQAQAQAEQASDQYIGALYQHNMAKLSLARAMGVAQEQYRKFLGGRQP